MSGVSLMNLMAAKDIKKRINDGLGRRGHRD